MKTLLAAATFLLVACGGPKKFLLIDAEAAPYVVQFEEASSLYGESIKVDNLVVVKREGSFFESTKLATCILQAEATPTIYINNTFYPRLTEWDKRELLFHEMGHCVLGLPHIDSQQSLMYPWHLGTSKYNALTHDAYDRRLFTEDLRSRKWVLR